MATTSRQTTTFVAFFAVLFLLIVLGYWQLIRGLEKAEIQAQASEGANSDQIITQAPADWETLAYSIAELRGNWREQKQFLLQNRLRQGQPGVEVLVPFELVSGAILLINRGWVAAVAGSTEDIPEIRPVSSTVAVRGQLYLPEKGFTLGSTYQGNLRWPLPVLYYDFDALTLALGTALEPAVLVLDQQHPDSFVTIWRPSSITPERHYAYVAQWWGLALTLIIFGFIWRRKARNQPALSSND